MNLYEGWDTFFELDNGGSRELLNKLTDLDALSPIQKLFSVYGLKQKYRKRFALKNLATLIGTFLMIAGEESELMIASL